MRRYAREASAGPWRAVLRAGRAATSWDDFLVRLGRAGLREEASRWAGLGGMEALLGDGHTVGTHQGGGTGAAGYLTPFDDGYPACWADRLGDAAPSCLRVTGPVPSARWLGMVGVRDAAQEDLVWAAAVAAEAVRLGFGVVSGGARGIDRAAVGGALAVGGVALELLATGLGAFGGAKGTPCGEAPAEASSWPPSSCDSWPDARSAMGTECRVAAGAASGSERGTGVSTGAGPCLISEAHVSAGLPPAAPGRARGRGFVGNGSAGFGRPAPQGAACLASEEAEAPATSCACRLAPRSARLPEGLVRASGLPDGAEFSTAMAWRRNAWIYGASTAVVVARAQMGRGGSWGAARDGLRKRWAPLIVRGDPTDPAARALVALGAVPLAHPEGLQVAIEAAQARWMQRQQGRLFGGEPLRETFGEAYG